MMNTLRQRMAEIQSPRDLSNFTNEELTVMVGLMAQNPKPPVNYDNQHTEQWD